VHHPAVTLYGSFQRREVAVVVLELAPAHRLRRHVAETYAVAASWTFAARLP